jgi:coenzyme Q-binding protein COQ10
MAQYQVVKRLDCCCEELFELAADIERYPEFLPGWEAVRVLQRDCDRLHVEQHLGFPAFSHAFVSTARLEPPERVFIRSQDGPFRDLQIEWRFEACDEGLCQVSFRMEYELASHMLEIVAEPVFQAAASDVVARFRARARELYGCTIFR